MNGRQILTDDFIRNHAPPPAGRIEVRDTEVKGLSVRISSAGGKSFVVRGRVKGGAAPLRITLGSFPEMDVEAARAQATAQRTHLRKGADPREVKRAEIAAKKIASYTFRALIADWTEMKLVNKSLRYRTEAVRSITKNLAPLMDSPLAEIKKRDVTAILGPVAKRSATMAMLTGTYAAAAYAWQMKNDDELPRSPFENLPYRDGLDNARDRKLTEDELRAIWKATEPMPFPHGPFIQMSLLTLLRREEVAGMRWSEIEGDTLTIQAARMKGGRCGDEAPDGSKVHIVHLSAAALAILAAIPRRSDNDCVFWSAYGNGPIKNVGLAKAMVDKNLERPFARDWRPHDFRRSGASWLNEHGFDSTVCDKLLGHTDKKLSGVGRIYNTSQHLPARAEALDVWGAFVAGGGK
jgi:integrase